jgi:quercetin dioxygenase-like cupin family protein
MRVACLSLPVLLAACSSEPQHRPHSHDMAMGGPRIPGGCEAPSAMNHGREGCYLDAVVDIGRLPPQVHWHIDEFPDADEARRSRTRASVIVTAYGRTFLQTVNGNPAWRARGGSRIARVGPLPAPQGTAISVRFMQAMTAPGVTTRPHRHPGPEAFHVLDGAICLETPTGAQTVAAGGSLWAAGATPMQLTSAGDGIRRSLLIVIHPSQQPWMTQAPDWQPRDSCRAEERPLP